MTERRLPSGGRDDNEGSGGETPPSAFSAEEPFEHDPIVTIPEWATDVDSAVAESRVFDALDTEEGFAVVVDDPTTDSTFIVSDCYVNFDAESCAIVGDAEFEDVQHNDDDDSDSDDEDERSDGLMA
jgi:hypothetical protein